MGELHVTGEWLEAVRGWETYLRAASRPDTTIYLRTYHLRRLAHEHDNHGPWELTFDDLTAWLGRYAWADETRRAYRASLRSFYAWGQLAGHVPLSPAGLLPAVRVPRGRPRPAPETILDTALAAAPDRERLMLLLAARAGLRRGEIARVHTNDLVEDLDGWSLRIRGKGGHVREVPLCPDVARELRALPVGWAFPGQIGGHLSPAHVGKLVSEQLPPGWTAHKLRHRFATRLRARGVQLDVIQELLGHARMETTLIYTAIPHDDARAAVMAAA